MIIAALKTGVILAIVTMVMTKPVLFMSYMHVIVLLGCTSLIVLYVGGFKPGIRWVGITLVGYILLHIFIDVNGNGETFVKGEYIAPVIGPVSSPYGPRASSPDGFHYGIDFAVPEGTRVLASKAGTVCCAGYKGNILGNVVEIDHQDGTQTMYAHNSQVLVYVGQSVKQGDVIALSGNTGRSTGPHVHFEIRLDKEKTSVDPALHLNLQ